MAESVEELKSLLRKVKEKSEKSGLKLNIQKTKIMASGPIIPWQIDGETMETVRDFIFLGSKITADGDCSHEIQRHLLLGRKAMTNLDVLKSRDITLPTKVHLVKAMAGLMHETGCSGPVHWDDPEEWDGEGGRRGARWGTHVYSWLIHVNVRQKPLQYCKVISLQLKLIN